MANPEQQSPPPAAESEPADRGDAADRERASGIVDFLREAWSQALVAVDATEEEVQKILSRLGGWVEMGPEEARRLGLELAERLKGERSQLEARVESAVDKALGPFRIPTRDDLAELHARVSVLEARIDRLIGRRGVTGR